MTDDDIFLNAIWRPVARIDFKWARAEARIQGVIDAAAARAMLDIRCRVQRARRSVAQRIRRIGEGVGR